MLRKIISSILAVSLILTQPVFAQGVAELNIGKYLNQMPAVKPDSFRPAHLRYVSYDLRSNDFKLLLDQGDAKLQDATQELFNYFLIGLSLPNDKFWVNLRPDAPEQIIDPELEKTDMGKIMLEADLQLKKDTAGWTSPQNPEGKAYWDKLYKKAGELFGTENITIPTITRPWIVPGEVIIRESEDSAYIYKANLKVMLEEDYLTGRGERPFAPAFADPRMKELNKYSTQLIKELILPKLTQEINTSKKYAQLRQVFFSLILSRWFKDKYKGKPGQYSQLIDSRNLDKLSSKDSWSKDYYFNEYKKSFQQGEYNLKEQITTPTGQVIRSYVSGGANMTGSFVEGSFKTAASPLTNDIKKYIPLGLLAIIGLTIGTTFYYKVYEPYIERRDKVRTEYMLNNKRAEFNAKYAIKNILDDKQLSSEDREKLKGFFSDHEVLDGNALLKAAQAALDYFYAQQYKHEIASRLEKIRDGLKPFGSSPLTEDKEKIVKILISLNDLLPEVVKLKSTEDILKDIHNEYELLGKAGGIKDSLYEKWYNFEYARRSWFKKFIQDFLASDFHDVLKEKYPNISGAFRLAGDALRETKKEFDRRILEEKKIKVLEFINSKEKIKMIKAKPRLKKEFIKRTRKDGVKIVPILDDDVVLLVYIIYLALLDSGEKYHAEAVEFEEMNQQLSYATSASERNIERELHDSLEGVKEEENSITDDTESTGGTTHSTDNDPEDSHYDTDAGGDFDDSGSSPLMPGGIDFTRINYLTRPMGSFQGLDLRLPLLSKVELEGIDIKQELAALEQMISAKIDVSTDRLKRLLAAMSQKDAFTSQRETQLLPLLLRLCWLKEERGVETTPDFRAVLLIADTGLFVEQGNTKYSLN